MTHYHCLSFLFIFLEDLKEVRGIEHSKDLWQLLKLTSGTTLASRSGLSSCARSPDERKAGMIHIEYLRMFAHTHRHTHRYIYIYTYIYDIYIYIYKYIYGPAFQPPLWCGGGVVLSPSPSCGVVGVWYCPPSPPCGVVGGVWWGGV